MRPIFYYAVHLDINEWLNALALETPPISYSLILGTEPTELSILSQRISLLDSQSQMFAIPDNALHSPQQNNDAQKLAKTKIELNREQK